MLIYLSKSCLIRVANPDIYTMIFRGLIDEPLPTNITGFLDSYHRLQKYHYIILFHLTIIMIYSAGSKV